MQLIINFLYILTTSIFGQAENVDTWKITQNWEKRDNSYSFAASSEELLKQCSNPNLYLRLPQIVHGVHEIMIDGKLVFSSGDNTFSSSSPFYYHPSIECKLLVGKKIEWRVTTYSKFFSRFRHLPFTSLDPGKSKFFDLQLNTICFSSLLFIVLFSLICFFGKIDKRRLIATTAGGIFLSFYALLTVNSDLPMQISMLSAHKFADLTLSLGMLMYVYSFYLGGLLSRLVFRINCMASLVGMFLIFIGNNGDIVQLGTTIEMPFTFTCLVYISWRLSQIILESKLSVGKFLESLSIFAFISCGTNDLLHIFGVIDSHMMLPVGATFGLFFLAAAANADIEKTYHERDDLVSNLQNKVNEQTKHLTGALEQVKSAQAELVHSARLASLGTLSAGIAHEINNAINFVNGAVIPLERKVMKSIPESDRIITEKLFAAIKEGTHLTVEIVRSLRNFTGLNQAKVKDVNIKETVTSVVTILKSKLTHINLEINIRPDLTLNCYQVGMNQIFMNLITNAIDVMPAQNGRIEVNAFEESADSIVISISDNGSGMKDEIKNRIFDPFFTTKDVGKGTGLGLHIVQKEVERHSGSISVMSELNKGTSFTIKLPKNVEPKEIKDAA